MKLGFDLRNKEDITIIGNTVEFESSKIYLENYMKYLIDQGIHYMILEYVDECQFIKVSTCQNHIWQNSKQNAPLRKLRLFGAKGDLSISIDANRCNWRYIGESLDYDITSLEAKDFWESFKVQYPEEYEAGRGLNTIEHNFILWGIKGKIGFREDKVGKNTFNYPIEDAVEKDRGCIKAIEYTLFGRTQFVRYYGLEVIRDGK